MGHIISLVRTHGKWFHFFGIAAILIKESDKIAAAENRQSGNLLIALFNLWACGCRGDLFWGSKKKNLEWGNWACFSFSTRNYLTNSLVWIFFFLNLDFSYIFSHLSNARRVEGIMEKFSPFQFHICHNNTQNNTQNKRVCFGQYIIVNSKHLYFLNAV